MRCITLTQGHQALVDDEDYDRLNQYKWFAHRNRSGNVYARRSIHKPKPMSMHMHKEVLLTSCEVDHIDGNGLNNQKSNLRICSRAQNNQNKRCASKTDYKGVMKYHFKYKAQIKYQGKVKYLGLFDTAEDAAKAYDAEAKQLFGEFAKLNF